MHYILERSGKYYYSRRVPHLFKDFDRREYVRVSLNTDSRKTAIKKAVYENERLETYWKSLAETGQKYEEQAFAALVERSRLLGFAYQPNAELALLPFDQLLQRVFQVENLFNKPHVEAVLGGITPPVIKLGDVLPRFWEYSKDQTLNKSPHQIEKWKNPREKAMRNLINCVGSDKPLHEFIREDMLHLRSWWIDRITAGEVVCASANKDFMHVRTILTTVADNLKIKLDTDHLFKKLRFKMDDSQQRLPFETAYITDVLLDPKNLTGLSEQEKYALYAIADTGAGIAEQVGLEPEDIVLDEPIPHICIVRRKKKGLKTKYRARKIPLVGYALEAFKACPKGFSDYKDRPDALSTMLGKYLNENELFPTEQHSVYSLRHSFQDRLLAVNTPDRVQADLMGHKFSREVYGKGSTLEQKHEWLRKISLR
jgi:integrase